MNSSKLSREFPPNNFRHAGQVILSTSLSASHCEVNYDY